MKVNWTYALLGLVVLYLLYQQSIATKAAAAQATNMTDGDYLSAGIGGLQILVDSF